MLIEQPLSKWIKQRRRILDLTQAELADRIGCSPSTLQKFEEGTRRPSKQMAELLAIHLEIPANEKASFLRTARSGEDDLSSITPPPSVTPVTTALKIAIPHNLPLPPTPLIGRREDIRAIHNLLTEPTVRLVTIVGTPGVGKTRLSLELALQLVTTAAARFADGVWFVPLAAIHDPALVLSVLTQALDLRQSGVLAPVEQLVHHLRDKHTLLVLDNFEQIIDAASHLSELLARCPTLKLLVTSRSPLLLRGEYQHSLAPFAVPSVAKAEQMSAALAEVQALAAVQLFVSTVQRFDPRFQLTPANTPTILKICSRLDGVALAIELAAARLRQFNAEALLTHLQQPTTGALALLTDGARDLPARHRTLQNAIAWSYDLLDAAAQRLFAVCGVFVGGFTYAALSYVSADSNAGNQYAGVLNALQTLLDHSLLAKAEQADGQIRYLMLETIGEFARRQVQANDAEPHVRQRHAHYFAQMAHRAADITNQAIKGQLYQQMEPDHPNLRVALRWLLDHQPEAGLRMANALEGFWFARGFGMEGIDWLQNAVRVNPQLTFEHAKAWLGMASMVHVSGSFANREEYANTALQICQQLGDETLLPACYRQLGLSKHAAQKFAEAEKYFRLGWEIGQKGTPTPITAELQALVALMQRNQGLFNDAVRTQIEEALTALHALGEAGELGRTYASLCWFNIQRGDYGRALPLAPQALYYAHQSQDKHALGMAESSAGDVAFVQGAYRLADRHYQAALQYFNEILDHVGINMVIYRLGHVAELELRYSAAEAQYQQALQASLKLNAHRYYLRCLLGLSSVTLAKADPTAARQFLTDAQNVVARDPLLLTPQDRVDYERLLAVLQPTQA